MRAPQGIGSSVIFGLLDMGKIGKDRDARVARFGPSTLVQRVQVHLEPLPDHTAEKFVPLKASHAPSSHNRSSRFFQTPNCLIIDAGSFPPDIGVCTHYMGLPTIRGIYCGLHI